MEIFEFLAPIEQLSGFFSIGLPVEMRAQEKEMQFREAILFYGSSLFEEFFRCIVLRRWTVTNRK